MDYIEERESALMIIPTQLDRKLTNNLKITASLFDHHVYLVSVLHLKSCGRIRLFNSLTVKYESAGIRLKALSLTVSVHELF